MMEYKKVDEYYGKAAEMNVLTNVANVANMRATLYQRRLNTLNNQPDRDEWIMDVNPTDIGAFYNPEKNTIIVPAGTLQGSLFNKEHPRYLNYGAIGAAIGHEITHGFDNIGLQYDKTGSNIPWWDNKTAKEFEKKTKCFIDMYDEYTFPQLGMHVNGNLTLGENIADNGAISQAYQAYKNFQLKQGKEEQKLPGLQKYTNDQMFFISWAQTWCTKYNNLEELKQTLVADAHAPGKYRAIGPLSNSEDFVRAFQCQNSKMDRDSKCKIW